MKKHETAIGTTIARIRRQQGLKLAAVSRLVPVSTLNAIEQGRMIPSLAMVDAITAGLALPLGALDLPYLASVRDNGKRVQVLERLLANKTVPFLDVQRTLRQVALDPMLSIPQRAHVRYLLADLQVRQGRLQRATIILTHILHEEQDLTGSLLLNILSHLGQYYLRMNHPEEALSPLLRAVRLQPANEAWEASLCNLGLAWWALGHYVAARTQWENAVTQVKAPIRRAHAYLGIGNAALRDHQYMEAMTAYRQALELYVSAHATPTARLRVFNNLLVCCIRLQQWPEAEELVAEAACLQDVEAVVLGEFLATQAEWAWSVEREGEAMRLIRAAKQTLGTSTVLSWFTVRLLEITVKGVMAEEVSLIVHEVEAQLANLLDVGLGAAIRVRLAQLVLERGQIDDIRRRLTEIARLFPPVGR